MTILEQINHEALNQILRKEDRYKHLQIALNRNDAKVREQERQDQIKHSFYAELPIINRNKVIEFLT